MLIIKQKWYITAKIKKIDDNMNVIYKCTKTQESLFKIDALGRVKGPISTKHTSCSLYFLKCCFLNVFSYFFMQPERVKDAHDLN